MDIHQHIPELLAALRDLPKLPENPRKACILCHSLYDEAGARKVYTGIFNAKLEVCHDCARNARNDGMAGLFCLGCKKFFGFKDPEKHPCGFVFEKHGCYHLLRCPSCAPTSFGSIIVELDKHARAVGYDRPDDPDLRKEVEVKQAKVQQEIEEMQQATNLIFGKNVSSS